MSAGAAARRGPFITIEGGDGAGKSTQVARLAETLKNRGHDVVVTREPGGSPGAEAIRALLVRGEIGRWSPITEALLMYAARADHLERTINPARAGGAVVISDRFSDSTMAYQGQAGALGEEAVHALERLVVGKDSPDLTIILDAPVSSALARAATSTGEDRFESMGAPYQGRVREAFLKIAALHPERCVLVDASRSIEETAQDIEAAALSRLGL